jgi:hypothetical protein
VPAKCRRSETTSQAEFKGCRVDGFKVTGRDAGLLQASRLPVVVGESLRQSGGSAAKAAGVRIGSDAVMPQ